MKKIVKIDERAAKEIKLFSEDVQAKITAAIKILERDGFLKEPYAKRIDDQLFEIRIRYQGQWRALYAYLGRTEIIILLAFQKKTEKTPKKEIKTALKRLGEYF